MKDTNPKDAVGIRKWRQFFVVPRQVMWEVAIGMLEGALKYGRHNYRGAGVRASVYCDAALGHIEQFIEGEDIDQDSGLSHITKAICSLVVLRDAMMNDLWTDDRPPRIKDMDGLRDRLQLLVNENFDRHADKNPHHWTQVEDGAAYAGVREGEILGVADRRIEEPVEVLGRDLEVGKYYQTFRSQNGAVVKGGSVWHITEVVEGAAIGVHRSFPPDSKGTVLSPNSWFVEVAGWEGVQ